MDFTCDECGKTFDHAGHYNIHLAMHQRKRKAAATTSTVFIKKAKLLDPPQSEEFGVRMIHRGLKDLFKIYRASFKRVYTDIAVITTMLFAHMAYLLELMVRDNDGIKAHLRLVLPIFAQFNIFQDILHRIALR